jgi:hypothetical protein
MPDDVTAFVSSFRHPFNVPNMNGSEKARRVWVQARLLDILKTSCSLTYESLTPLATAMSIGNDFTVGVSTITLESTASRDQEDDQAPREVILESHPGVKEILENAEQCQDAEGRKVLTDFFEECYKEEVTKFWDTTRQSDLYKPGSTTNIVGGTSKPRSSLMSIIYSTNPELHIWATVTRNAQDPVKRAKNKQMFMKRLYTSLVSLPEEVRQQHSEEVKTLVSEVNSASPVVQTLFGIYSQE